MLASHLTATAAA